MNENDPSLPQGETLYAVSDGINSQSILATSPYEARYVFAQHFGLNPTNPEITVSLVDPPVRNAPEVLRAKMNYARELIRLKHYQEARELLRTVNHPAALRWLRQLDKPKYAQGHHFSDTQPISSRLQRAGDVEWLATGSDPLPPVRSAPKRQVSARSRSQGGCSGKFVTVIIALVIVSIVLIFIMFAVLPQPTLG